MLFEKPVGTSFAVEARLSSVARSVFFLGALIHSLFGLCERRLRAPSAHARSDVRSLLRINTSRRRQAKYIIFLPLGVDMRGSVSPEEITFCRSVAMSLVSGEWGVYIASIAIVKVFP